jgi:cell division protein FtsQ
MKIGMLRTGKWLWSIPLVILMALITVLNTKGDYKEDLCNSIEIKIQQPEELPLISEEDVLQWILPRKLVGERLDKIELSNVEQKIREMLQVKNCEMHIDLRGILTIEVEPFLPVARILRDGAPDYYVSDDGTFFPTSNNYTARVILLSGNYFTNKISMTDNKSVNLLSFLKHVNDDTFWKAQLTQVTIDNQDNMYIVPLLGEHIINFGNPDEVVAKLRRLKVFYKQIYPVKGWGNFSEVSVVYANQVVCK